MSDNLLTAIRYAMWACVAALLLLLGASVYRMALAADVTLAWDYQGSQHQGFKLRYKLAGGQYQTVADNLPPASRQYTHKGAPTGTLLYRLTAYNASAESSAAYFWAVIDEEPAGPPPAPTNATTITINVSTP